MAIPILAHKMLKKLIGWISKTILFLIFFCFSAKIFDASKFISYETSSKFSKWLYGFSSQDNFDDLWFYTDVLVSILIAFLLCYLSIRLINSIRKK